MIRDLVDDIVTVPETAIRDALRLVMERAKLVIEPSAAVGIAATRGTDAFRRQGAPSGSASSSAAATSTSTRFRALL